MNSEEIRGRFKESPKLKRFVDWLIMNQVQTRPRWYIRMLAPLYQHRGKCSVIHRSVRMDTPDVIIGNNTRIGLHNTIIGPVKIGNNVNLAQGITVTALNHNFTDSTKRIDEQGVSTNPVTIEDDIWIGANAVILPGVNIGNHSVVAAGAVVTKDVPAHSLVAGVPAKVIKEI